VKQKQADIISRSDNSGAANTALFAPLRSLRETKASGYYFTQR
jgi:hypothetical protein